MQLPSPLKMSVLGILVVTVEEHIDGEHRPSQYRILESNALNYREIVVAPDGGT